MLEDFMLQEMFMGPWEHLRLLMMVEIHVRFDTLNLNTIVKLASVPRLQVRIHG